MLPPNLDHEPSRLLLLPSVFGGLLSVFVDADFVKVGIMVVFKFLTLAERAMEAFVGVVTALGSSEAGGFVGTVWVICTLMWEPCEVGRA